MQGFVANNRQKPEAQMTPGQQAELQSRIGSSPLMALAEVKVSRSTESLHARQHAMWFPLSQAAFGLTAGPRSSCSLLAHCPANVCMHLLQAWAPDVVVSDMSGGTVVAAALGLPYVSCLCWRIVCGVVSSRASLCVSCSNLWACPAVFEPWCCLAANKLTSRWCAGDTVRVAAQRSCHRDSAWHADSIVSDAQPSRLVAYTHGAGAG